MLLDPHAGAIPGATYPDCLEAIMTRTYIAAILTALFVALAGCESNIDNDTGDTLEQVVVNATINGVQIDGLPVSIEDTAHEVLIEGKTGETLKVDLKEGARPHVGGSDADITADGYRISVVDDLEYAHEHNSAKTGENEVALNRYLELSGLECVVDIDRWIDGEWQAVDPVELSGQSVKVVDAHNVEMSMELDNWVRLDDETLKVSGDTLELETEWTDIRSLVDIDISSGFHLTVVELDWSTVYVSCS